MAMHPYTLSSILASSIIIVIDWKWKLAYQPGYYNFSLPMRQSLFIFNGARKFCLSCLACVEDS